MTPEERAEKALGHGDLWPACEHVSHDAAIALAEAIAREIRAAIVEAREACAKVALRKYPIPPTGEHDGFSRASEAIAAAIRALPPP